MGAAERVWTALAAVSGFLGVAFGAFAAHGLSDPAAKELMRAGSSYQLVHSLAALACLPLGRIGARAAGFAPALFLCGALLFSGSLYALALGAPRAVGLVTPFGGLAFLAGWLMVAWAAAFGRGRG